MLAFDRFSGTTREASTSLILRLIQLTLARTFRWKMSQFFGVFAHIIFDSLVA